MTTLETNRPGRTTVGAFSWWALAPAVAQFAALIGTAGRYGYHPDELYFIVCGQHPAWGYPDQPMAVPLLAAAMNHLDQGSLIVLRAPSALAAGLTCVVAALIARECGGRAVAQVIAAGCTAVSAFALATGHNVSTTTFDMLSTTVLGWLVMRALLRRQPRALLAAGVVVGVGFEFKPQVALVAVVLLAALAMAGPRWRLRSAHLWTGAAGAVVLACPTCSGRPRTGGHKAPSPPTSPATPKAAASNSCRSSSCSSASYSSPSGSPASSPPGATAGPVPKERKHTSFARSPSLTSFWPGCI